MYQTIQEMRISIHKYITDVYFCCSDVKMQFYLCCDSIKMEEKYIDLEISLSEINSNNSIPFQRQTIRICGAIAVQQV